MPVGLRLTQRYYTHFVERSSIAARSFGSQRWLLICQTRLSIPGTLRTPRSQRVRGSFRKAPKVPHPSPPCRLCLAHQSPSSLLFATAQRMSLGNPRMSSSKMSRCPRRVLPGIRLCMTTKSSVRGLHFTWENPLRSRGTVVKAAGRGCRMTPSTGISVGFMPSLRIPKAHPLLIGQCLCNLNLSCLPQWHPRFPP